MVEVCWIVPLATAMNEPHQPGSGVAAAPEVESRRPGVPLEVAMGPVEVAMVSVEVAVEYVKVPMDSVEVLMDSVGVLMESLAVWMDSVRE